MPMTRLPSLNALHAFEAAARRNSFQAAADELHVTPTAVSHQIRELEATLGHTLFRRRPRPIRLTRAGRQLYPALQEGFERIRAGVSALQAAGEAGPLVVTTTPAFASRWLIHRLGALGAACDNQEFAVNASEQVVDLVSGRAHLAVRYARSPDPDLACTALCSDRYVPVARPELLASGPGIVEPSDVRHYPLIEFDWKRADPHAPTWDRWWAEAGLADNDRTDAAAPSRLRFSEEVHAIEAVLEGQGIALASDFLVARELRQGVLVRASDFSIEGMTFFAMHAADSPRAGTLNKAVEFLRDQVGREAHLQEI